MNLLKKLQKEQQLTYLFIAHDLSMVKYISDRIAVMYQGKIVELGTADEVYHQAFHPYTKSLLSAIPLPDPQYERNRKRVIYQPTIQNKPEEMFEITPGHFVLTTKEQAEIWKNSLS